MARCTLRRCLMLAVVNFLTVVSNGEEDMIARNGEKVLKFTLRTFTNTHGTWVTQVQMQREGLPTEDSVPRVQFSVEQNRTSGKPPRLVAKLAAASLLDEEMEELESERFELTVRPKVGWLAANVLCKTIGQRLALPTAEAFQWTQDNIRKIGVDNVTEIFIGISNIVPPDNSFVTVLNQPVMNGTAHLKHHMVQCGVMKASETEPTFTLSLDDCIEQRPYLCEKTPSSASDSIDVSPWLAPDISTDYEYTTYEYYR